MDALQQVIILEDDPSLAEALGEFLRISGGFTTQWVDSLAGLWDALPKFQADCLLLDYRLPDGNGIQVLEELPRRGFDLPVIMITGQGDERIAVQAIQLGAADYLIKGSDYVPALPTLVKKAIRSHQLQKMVERSTEQLRYQALLLNNVRDAIVVWDPLGRITYINQAAEKLYLLNSREYIGQNVSQNYLSTFIPEVLVPPKEGTIGQEIERKHRSKDLWVSSRVAVLRDHRGEGKFIGYMDVTRDITARKQMEDEIYRAQIRVAESSRMAAIGGLASGVAHHINNPLCAIIAEAQILKNNPSQLSEIRESAEAIEQAGWRVQHAVQQLLEFSKPLANTLEDLDLSATIRNVLELVDEQLKANGVTLQIDLAQNLPPVHGNSRQLATLWLNLLLMAKDATADGKSHLISIRSGTTQNGYCWVEFMDDGIPIPTNDMVRLFDVEFIKSPGGRGTGIELNICQEIVRQHNGQISAAISPKGETIFCVMFPLEVQ